MKLTAAILRKCHPGWAWVSVRDGFGWVYVGLGDTRQVTVYPVSQLECGSDDLCYTRWMVRHSGGGLVEDYSTWAAR